MTHLAKGASGHLLKNADGHLVKCPPVCPTSCLDCPSSFTLSASVDDRDHICAGPPFNIKCSELEDNPMVVADFDHNCTWSGLSGNSITCSNFGGVLYWVAAMQVENYPSCNLFARVLLAGNPCPPIGVWTILAGSCSGTITVS